VLSKKKTEEKEMRERGGGEEELNTNVFFLGSDNRELFSYTIYR